MASKNLVTIAQDEASQRIDRWLGRLYPRIPHGRIQKFLRTGDVRVDGQRVTGAFELKAGQVVKLPPQTILDLAMVPEDAPRTGPRPSRDDMAAFESLILFENELFLVLNKPHGLAVQGGTGVRRHVDGFLAARPGVHHIVHRLDRDTSGLLVVAKSPAVARELGKQFETKQVTKTYWALVAGVPKPPKGIIKNKIAKLPGKLGEKMAISADGQLAITRYCVLESAGTLCSWVELSPETGRTHQLRVHLQSLGFPIVGDGKYGWRSRDEFPLDRKAQEKLHLHAHEITFVLGEKEYTFQAPLPDHMAHSWGVLGFSIHG